MAQQTRTLPSGIVYSNELVMADAEETDAERRQRQQAERIAELRAQREA